MKIYKKPLFDIEEIEGLELSVLEYNESYEIIKQDIVIEIDLNTNKEGELVEHPVAICTKFDLVIIKNQAKSTPSFDFREPDDLEVVEIDRIEISLNDFDVEVEQDLLCDFNTMMQDMEYVHIDFVDSKITL